MAKLIVLATLLTALLAASTVSARFTVTTTVVEDEAENPGRQICSCQEQIHQQDNFEMCRRFLTEHAKGGGSYEGLEMVTENTHHKGQHLKECCKQMGNVREECRCEGLKMMMAMQHKELQRQMMHQAENLPQMCQLSPMRCSFGSNF